MKSGTQKITADSILTDLILQYPSLIPAIFLTGICGDFGSKTIHQICKEKAINESYLLNLLRVFTDEEYIPSEALPSYSVLQLSTLSSAIYPYFLDQLDLLTLDILKTTKALKCENPKVDMLACSKKLKPLFAEYRRLLSDRFEQQKQIVYPHISVVYELYYSPDYTSLQSDILHYSLEFYDGNIQYIQQSFEKIKELLEQYFKFNTVIQYVTGIFTFYQLNHTILAHDRIEQKLLKPLVLEMEESVITTFHKKNKSLRRNNYLSFHAETTPLNELSNREKEVLRLVAQGLMNKEIADHLQIGLTTVITHRKNIVEKLGIKTIPGLTVYAYTQGYLDDSILTNED